MVLVAIHSYRHGSLHLLRQQLNISCKQHTLMVNNSQRYFDLKKLHFWEKIAIINYNLLGL